MGVETVFIGIGSNLDKPVKQIDQALAILESHTKLTLKSHASYYQSSALLLDKAQRQPDYINTVAEVETELGAFELLDELQKIEDHQGRIRYEKRWQARTLDLDILLFGEQIINDAHLGVPHSGLSDRAFVLYPLYELCPDLVVPGVGVLAELIMHFESKKTSINNAGKAGSDAANLVKLSHVRKR